jgi:hypothetical protein
MFKKTIEELKKGYIPIPVLLLVVAAFIIVMTMTRDTPKPLVAKKKRTYTPIQRPSSTTLSPAMPPAKKPAMPPAKKPAMPPAQPFAAGPQPFAGF